MLNDTPSPHVRDIHRIRQVFILTRAEYITLFLQDMLAQRHDYQEFNDSVRQLRSEGVVEHVAYTITLERLLGKEWDDFRAWAESMSVTCPKELQEETYPSKPYTVKAVHVPETGIAFGPLGSSITVKAAPGETIKAGQPVYAREPTDAGPQIYEIGTKKRLGVVVTASPAGGTAADLGLVGGPCGKVEPAQLGIVPPGTVVAGSELVTPTQAEKYGCSPEVYAARKGMIEVTAPIGTKEEPCENRTLSAELRYTQITDHRVQVCVPPATVELGTVLYTITLPESDHPLAWFSRRKLEVNHIQLTLVSGLKVREAFYVLQVLHAIGRGSRGDTYRMQATARVSRGQSFGPLMPPAVAFTQVSLQQDDAEKADIDRLKDKLVVELELQFAEHLSRILSVFDTSLLDLSCLTAQKRGSEGQVGIWPDDREERRREMERKIAIGNTAQAADRAPTLQERLTQPTELTSREVYLQRHTFNCKVCHGVYTMPESQPIPANRTCTGCLEQAEREANADARERDATNPIGAQSKPESVQPAPEPPETNPCKILARYLKEAFDELAKRGNKPKSHHMGDLKED